MEILKYYQEERYSEAAVRARNEGYNQRRLHSVLNIFSDKKLQGKIIDLGCGDGALLKRLKEKVPQATLYGADLSEKGCELAKPYCYQTKALDFNEKLPYRKNFFDVVIAQEVIEHLQSPDLFLSECRRILKPGGYLLVTTPNILSWTQRILVVLGVYPTVLEVSKTNRHHGLRFLKKVIPNTQPVGHIHVFSRYALTDMLESYDFSIIDVQSVGIPYRLPFPLNMIYNGIDSFFNNFPSLGSDLVVLVKKNEE